MKQHGLIIAALRKIWLFSETRREAIKAAKIARGCYRCGKCNYLFKARELQVDHIIPIGKFIDWNTYIERLFCPVSNLMALCKECHETKTKSEKKII
jgi:5-methylcytosine-specific restriction endonuclease McrA